MKNLWKVVLLAMLAVICLPSYGAYLTSELQVGLAENGKNIYFATTTKGPAKKYEIIMYYGAPGYNIPGQDHFDVELKTVNSISDVQNIYVEFPIKRPPNTSPNTHVWYTAQIKETSKDWMSWQYNSSGKEDPSYSVSYVYPDFTTPIIAPTPTSLIPVPEPKLTAQIINPTDDKKITISWNMSGSMDNVNDIHIYVRTNWQNKYEYLGRTPEREDLGVCTSGFEWKKNGRILAPQFINGPQFGNSYKFKVYIIAENKNYGPFYTDSIYFQQNVAPTATPTVTPIPPKLTPTPTQTPIIPPWHIRMSWWTDHDITPERDGSKDIKYYRVAEENNLSGVQIGHNEWFTDDAGRTHGAVVAQAYDWQNNPVLSKDWMVIDAYIFFDPQIKRYIVTGIVTGANQDFYITPVAVLRGSTGLIYVTPTNVQPVIHELEGKHAYHITWDMQALVPLLIQQLGSNFGGWQFAGIDSIKHFTKTQNLGESPYISWDYWGILNDQEFANEPWKNHNHQFIWQWFIPNYNVSAKKIRVLGNTTKQPEILHPPSGFFKNDDGSPAIFINAGGFSSS